MTDPIPRRLQLRHQRLAGRLLALLDTLGTHDRRAPLPEPVAGAAWRTLDEAASLLGTSASPSRSRRPADIFVAALQPIARLEHLRKRDDPAVWSAARKIYPRRSKSL